VESSWSPLLPTIVIWVGLCPPIDESLSAEPE
jgi:hypothetical protein